jgi:hypothetical protein
MAKARETVTSLKDRLCTMAEFKALNSEQQEQLTRPFDEFNATIERQKLIAVIRDSSGGLKRPRPTTARTA